LQSISVIASGMVTGIGLNAPATCAAMRVGISSFAETRFIDKSGEWIIGSCVPLEESWRGIAKLVKMLAPAIRECLESVKGGSTEDIPILLCLSEKSRPGRFSGLEDQVSQELLSELGCRFHKTSTIISQGRVGGVSAIRQAREMILKNNAPYCIVAGTDTFMVNAALSAYQEKDRLLTITNSNGFIPGEAGAAVLLAPYVQSNKPQLVINGIGFGNEKAHIDSEEPMKADGMVQAVKAALSESKQELGDLDYRITDVNGEQYGFKEASLVLTRLLRKRKEEFDIWHPADCIGEVGAAIVPCVLGVALTAARKGYAPGHGVLCHFGNDDGMRGALVLRYSAKGGV